MNVILPFVFGVMELLLLVAAAVMGIAHFLGCWPGASPRCTSATTPVRHAGRCRACGSWTSRASSRATRSPA